MTERTGPIITLTAAAVAVIGVFGPWTSLGPISETGMDGSGPIVLILMVIAALFAGVSLSNGPNQTRGNLTIALGLIAGIIAVTVLLNNADRSIEMMGLTISASTGWGLWFALLGAGGVIAGGIITGRSGETMI